MNFPNGTVLDVGSGEGTLADFLPDHQKQKYLGIDISTVSKVIQIIFQLSVFLLCNYFFRKLSIRE